MPAHLSHLYSYQVMCFLVEPILSVCVRGYDSISLIDIVSHSTQNQKQFLPQPLPFERKYHIISSKTLQDSASESSKKQKSTALKVSSLGVKPESYPHVAKPPTRDLPRTQKRADIKPDADS